VWKVPELLVRCPLCEKETGTGINIDHVSFEKVVLGKNIIRCDRCGTQFTWDKKKVRLFRNLKSLGRRENFGLKENDVSNASQKT